MSRRIHNPSGLSPTTGFTLVELMVAMAISLLLFGLAFTLAQQLNNTADVVGSMSDVNENLRAAVNMVSRDLSQAGQNIPAGGIPIPSPSAGGTAINRPGPGTLTFPATGYMPALTPGYQLGRLQPTTGGANQIYTDIVTMIGVNQFSLFNQTAVNTTTSPPTISSTSATITVAAAAAGNVSPGQLIMLTNANASCLLAVSFGTPPNTTTGVITFESGDSDPLGVNQFPTLSANGTITSGPTSGTILQLETATTNGNTTTYAWPRALTAYPVSMTTYYLDNTNPGGRLMKQIIMGTAQPVALGINVMTITYTCSSGTSPTRNPSSPNTIQKVALTMIAETDHQNHINAQWYSKSITDSVAIQNLDFHNKYGSLANLTQN
jgi:prepilin-type N-terminal cleavage/methylation domain-containing protein